MRIALLIATTAMAAQLASAATRNESVTYVEGNLSNVVANSGGWLVLGGDTALELKTGLATVAIPYAAVAKATLGEIRKHPTDTPMYKVWSLHKRFSKNETQLLKVEFKDEQGEQKNATLELAKDTAENVVDTIARRNPQARIGEPELADAAQEPVKKDWWGDDYWKTTRNAGKWSQKQQETTTK